MGGDAEREIRGRKRVLARPMVLALLVQAGLLLVAGTIVVMVVETHPEPGFTAAKRITLPTRELEHRVSVSEFQQQVASLPVRERIRTQALSPLSLPSLPDLPERPSESSFSPSFHAGMMDSFSEFAAGLGKGKTGQAATFMGITDRGQRILILFDISQTVVNKSRHAGMPMERIRDEAIRLIHELEADTWFGLIQFSRIYETFQDTLIPASQGNREIAVAWMHSHFAGDSGTIPGRRGVRSYPRGIETVLEVAFAMNPEVIFILSDGAFWRTVSPGRQQRVPYEELRTQIERLSRAQGGRTRLHFIGFEIQPRDKEALERMVRATGGTLHEVGKR